MNSSKIERQPDSSKTFWEAAADTRWGNYISEIEQEILLDSASSFSEPGMCLEVGCEGGRWSTMLSDLGWRMTATDIDPAVLEVCQERNPTVRCILVDADDHQLPADDDSLDLIICFELPTVVGQPWFTAEAARTLKLGGKMVGSLNNLLSWRGAAVKLKSALLRGPHFYDVTFPAFRKSLLDHGIAIDISRGCCWPPFSRHCDSRWIPSAAALEQILRLDRLPSFSPWVVFSATKMER